VQLPDCPDVGGVRLIAIILQPWETN